MRDVHKRNLAAEFKAKAWVRRQERGNTIVEFALVLPLFFLLVFGVLDFGRLFYQQTTLQEAVRQAGRYASTGNSMNGMTRAQSIQAVAQRYAPGLNVSNLQINASNVCAPPSPPCPAGTPGATVTISLTTNLQLVTPLIANFFPNGAYPFTVSSTFQNEQFPLGQSH